MSDDRNCGCEESVRLRAELARLRRVLEETPENVERFAVLLVEDMTPGEWLFTPDDEKEAYLAQARRILAALRARTSPPAPSRDAAQASFRARAERVGEWPTSMLAATERPAPPALRAVGEGDVLRARRHCLSEDVVAGDLVTVVRKHFIGEHWWARGENWGGGERLIDPTDASLWEPVGEGEGG